MDTGSELEKAKTEVYRKIGRNLLLFQLMEQKLKLLIAFNDLKYTEGKDLGIINKRLSTLQKETMGILCGKFYDSFFDVNKKRAKKQNELSDSTFSISVYVEGGSGYLKEKKRTLAFIVEGRNELVHHFLRRLNMDIISWLDSDKFLDEQHTNLLREISNLEIFISGIQEALIKYSSDLKFKQKRGSSTLG